MDETPLLVWFRDDLRVADHPALAAAPVKLGESYPKPIVEHAKARERALKAFDETKD
jgi:deoxyribodipyrimidine photo-lyase